MLSTILSPFKLIPGFRPLFSGLITGVGFGFDSPGIIGVSPMTSFGTDGSGSLAEDSNCGRRTQEVEL